VYAELGRTLTTIENGSSADFNLAAETGTPGLDGFGMEGGGAHSPLDDADLATLTPRAYLLGRLLMVVAMTPKGAMTRRHGRIDLAQLSPLVGIRREHPARDWTFKPHQPTCPTPEHRVRRPSSRFVKKPPKSAAKPAAGWINPPPQPTATLGLPRTPPPVSQLDCPVVHERDSPLGVLRPAISRLHPTNAMPLNGLRNSAFQYSQLGE
jgi:hypothetical protein